MIVQAKAKFARVAPGKVRQVVDLIRGKSVVDSLIVLTHVNRSATKMVSKIVNAAVASAKEKGLSEDQLYISKVMVDQGPSWKRYRAVAFGRATSILKKTSHVTLELDLITK
jgi:large subunit ribosomal protein L22